MRALWVSPTEQSASPEDLAAEGIAFEAFEPAGADPVASRLGSSRGYAKRDDVTRSGANPRDESALAKEADEHAHVADEVRLVVDGVAVYDVLSADGARWLRLWLGPGDAVVIPAKRYHRLLCPPNAVFRYVEVSGDPTGLLPLYRVSDDATRAV